MRVTVEPGPLIGIVALLNARAPRRDAVVRLSASGGKVWVESNVTAAVTDAAVWEQGQCSVSRLKLLGALEAQRDRSSVTLVADRLGLRVGGVAVPASEYLAQATQPGSFQIFLATKAGTVSRPRPIKLAA
jgi:hypothetical protein